MYLKFLCKVLYILHVHIYRPSNCHAFYPSFHRIILQYAQSSGEKKISTPFQRAENCIAFLFASSEFLLKRPIFYPSLKMDF